MSTEIITILSILGFVKPRLFNSVKKPEISVDRFKVRQNNS